VGNIGAIPRLGLRSLCMHDSPVGVRGADYSSVFPSGQTTAATWDRVLFYNRGFAIGEEAKGKGVNVLLGPVAGPLGRMPASGRNWEGFSPDPVLTGVGIAESSKGIQDAGVVACAKHFIGNEQGELPEPRWFPLMSCTNSSAEHFRVAGEAKGYGFDISESLSSNIDDKTMHELYLWPFADAVRAGVGSVMCSYQQVNNSYSCQNSKLMNDLLKNELGFQGFIMSDWQAQHTGVASAAAGLDMSMPGDTVFNSGRSYWGANLTTGVLNGTVPEWRIDDMAMRIMAAIFKVGQTIEQDPVNFSFWTQAEYGPVHWRAKKGFQQINGHVDVRKDHGTLIREVAAKGSVVLKNSGVLPLQKPKFVVAVGEDAGPNPLGPNACGDRGCNNGTLALGWGSGTANFPYLVTPDAALQARAIQDGTRYESILSNYAMSQIQSLVALDNVTAIVFVNSDSGESYINVEGNMGDRNNLTLWKNGDDLIKSVSSRCPNTIVVIHSPGPVIVTDWYKNPNITAIVWAGFPGQESGNSIVDVLYGKVSPGRTPFSWGATRESFGPDVLYKPNNGKAAPQQDFSEGVFIDYRHFDKSNTSLIYEFGFGLSYTTFEYSNIKVGKSNVSAYQPTTGKTAPAPTFGNFSRNPGDYLVPANFTPVYLYVYPYLNTTDLQKASTDANYGKKAADFLPANANDGTQQPLLRSSGKSSPGGNAQLYDVLYTVTADVTNTGSIAGDEIPQLYVSLGGPTDPLLVLRGFDRLRIDPGQTKQFKVALTRRDLSNWDTTLQDWFISNYTKTAYVGRSSRKLDLSAKLA